MAEKKKGTTAGETAKKAASRKKTPSQSTGRDVAAPKRGAREGAAKKAAARKEAAPKAAAGRAGSALQTSPEDRYRLIQEAAYLKAEQEGFSRDPSNYWLVAEAEVDARLAKSR